MKFSDGELKFSDSELKFSDSELKFSDSELDLANIETNGRPYERGVNKGMQIRRSVPFSSPNPSIRQNFGQIRNHNHIRK